MQLERGQLGPLRYAAIGSGEPVAVLAGLSPTTGVGSPWLTKLSLKPFEPLSRSRRVLLFNRRPHLERGLPFSAFAAEQAAALASLAPVDVVGISTGGSLAQQLAAEHPDTVHRLVLASTGWTLPPPTRELQARVARRIRAGARSQAVALLTADLLPTRPGRLAGALAGRALGERLLPHPHDLDGMATLIEAEDPFDLTTLPTIAAPTLVIGGDRDEAYPTEFIERTARLIPGSRLELIGGRGHVSVLRDPRFTAALADFLD